MKLNNIRSQRSLLQTFKILYDEFDSKFSITQITNDSIVLDEISTFLMEVLNIVDNDDCDYIIASYVLNYDNVDGDFSIYDEPDEEILSPKRHTYSAERSYYSSVYFVESFDSHTYYLPSMMLWDIQEGHLSSEDSEHCDIEDITDTWDEEITIDEKNR